MPSSTFRTTVVLSQPNVNNNTETSHIQVSKRSWQWIYHFSFPSRSSVIVLQLYDWRTSTLVQNTYTPCEHIHIHNARSYMQSTPTVLPAHKAVCTNIIFCTICEGWKDHSFWHSFWNKIKFSTEGLLNLTGRLQLNKLETKEVYILASYHLIDLQHCIAVLPDSGCDHVVFWLQPFINIALFSPTVSTFHDQFRWTKDEITQLAGHYCAAPALRKADCHYAAQHQTLLQTLTVFQAANTVHILLQIKFHAF